MTSNTATPKQTGGAGYSFEDKVGAYFCIRLLQGSFPFDPAFGVLQGIAFQNRVDGWFVDDVLLTLNDGGNTRKCGLSVKSNIQFGKKTAPADFVVAAWPLYLAEGSEAFVKGHDLLGLVTPPLASETRTPLMELLRLARCQSPEDLAGRLLSNSEDSRGYTSQETRELFKSFFCPEDLANKHQVTGKDTASLLKDLVLLQFDFLDPDSKDEADCLAACKLIVRNGTDANAANLWTSILGIVNTVRTAGGGLDREELVRMLRQTHELNEFPDFRDDWRRLISWGRERLVAVPDAIGGSFRLDRRQYISRLSDSLAESRLVAILGESGSGKSVIAKQVAQHFPQTVPVLWFDSDIFMASLAGTLRSEMGLSHSVPDVLHALAAQTGVIVLDGLERLGTEDSWRQVRLLLQYVQAGTKATPWLVMLTCSSDNWEWVQAKLLQAGIRPEAVQTEEINPFGTEDIEQVMGAFPALVHVVSLEHLRSLVSLPKILDIFARNVQLLRGVEAQRWSGESDIVEWYWREVVKAGDAGESRSGFLQTLAGEQAEDNCSRVPVLDVSPAHQPVITSLSRDGICEIRNECVSFSHDIIADWSRQRILVARQSQLPAFLQDRALNPRWHRAIRLYGMRVLEQDGADAWLREYERLGSIAALLFLDAAFLAVGSAKHLEMLWPVLSQEHGQLLKELLVRFLHAATYPHPGAAALLEADNRELAQLLRVHLRIPLWNYWLPMLRFLFAHREEVAQLVPDEVAQVCTVWLQRTAPDWPMRQEAARLALIVGRKTFLDRLGHAYDNYEKHRTRYRAALAAAHEFPDETADFALLGAARRLVPEIEENPQTEYLPPGSVVQTRSMFGSRDSVIPAPWPDGPKYRVDEAFRFTCLSEASLEPLMRERPDIVKEVILALLLSTPIERAERDEHSRRPTLHIESGVSFRHAFYLDGPFLAFLKIDWKEALDCIIRLVDFVTERWTEAIPLRWGVAVPVIAVNSGSGPRYFVGDKKVMGWYRGAWAEGAVRSALQALEKWFYDAVENQPEAAQEAVETILGKGRSVALLSMLWEIGRYKPDLFKSSLSPLLMCAQLYFWELEALISLKNLGLVTSPLQSQERLRLICDWEKMPHRSAEVRQYALGFSLREDLPPSFFDECRRRWSMEREFAEINGASPEWYGVLIAMFDPANWKDVEAQPGVVVKQFVPPKELEEQQVRLEQQQQEIHPLLFSFNCRQVLDNNKILTDEEARLLLDAVKRIAATPDGSDEDHRQKAAAVFGGIAVLLHNQREWLRESPEDETWCRSAFSGLYGALPAEERPWARDGETGISAEDFAAVVLAVTWAESPQERWTRESLVSLVARGHRAAIGCLVREAFSRREQLQVGYDQLVHLAIRWAELGHGTIFEGPEEDKGTRLNAWMQHSGAPFVDGTLPTNITGWADGVIRNGRRYQLRPRMRGRRKGEEEPEFPGLFTLLPHIDHALLLKSFAGIMLPTQARDIQEQEKWLEFWHDVLTCELAPMRVFDEQGNVVERYEAEEHSPPLDNFSGTFISLIFQLPADTGAQFWQPMLDLGPPGQLWLEWLLTDFLTEGLYNQPRDVFMPLWKSMIAYASPSQAWQYSDETRFAWQNLWAHLLGFAHSEVHLWEPQHTDVVQAMIGIYQSLVVPNLNNARWAAPFIAWLRQPAAAPSRTQALKWLSPVAQQAGGFWWGENHLEQNLGMVLCLCWDEQRAEVLGDEAVLLPFRSLVALLVKRNNATAMDLQDRIAADE